MVTDNICYPLWLFFPRLVYSGPVNADRMQVAIIVRMDFLAASVKCGKYEPRRSGITGSKNADRVFGMYIPVAILSDRGVCGGIQQPLMHGLL